MSLDSGRSWQRTGHRLNNPPFCGINNGFLWLNYQGMNVFSLRTPDSAPPGILTASD